MRQWWRLVMSVIVGGLMLSACSAVHSGLGTVDSPCFVALPTAKAAVHSPSDLAGVNLLRVGRLIHFHPLYRALEDRGETKSSEICVVALKGHFVHEQVAKAFGSHSSHLAVVFVSYPANHLVMTVIARHSFTRLAHTLLGGI